MHQTSATPREVTADVVEAMRQGRFHLYPITHVDQGLELLTGAPAGDLMTGRDRPLPGQCTGASSRHGHHGL